MDVIWTIDFRGLMGFPSVGKGTARAGKGRKGTDGYGERALDKSDKSDKSDGADESDKSRDGGGRA
jgi:hypothetical protein